MPESEAVIRALYQMYRRPLIGYVLRAVAGDYQLAEDIVQETMVRAWQNSSDLQVERAGRWLFTVARNLVISEYRRRAARVKEVQLVGHELEAAGDGIDEVLRTWEIAEVIGELSHLHRQVIIELFYRQQTISEVAALLEVPLGTVKSRNFYALRALRAALTARQ